MPNRVCVLAAGPSVGPRLLLATRTLGTLKETAQAIEIAAIYNYLRCATKCHDVLV